MQKSSQGESVRRKSQAAGFTLIEITISMAVLSILLLASAAAFSSNIFATGVAKKLDGAALFLETTMENVSAQPYRDLLVLDGMRVLDGADEASSHMAIEMRVFPRAVDLLQVQLDLTDTRTGMRTARLTTLRSKR